jgi:P27 family predicted phage terminase small subunit
VGAKPKPTHLKLLQGNPGKRPLNRDEPKPVPSRPTPPDELNDDAKIEWERLSRELYTLGLLTNIDRAALAAYCQAYGRWMTAERALAEMATRDQLTKGLLIKTTNGNAIQNPLVGTANKAMSDMMHYAVEFGLTPSSRSKIRAEGVKDEDEAEEYLRSR